MAGKNCGRILIHLYYLFREKILPSSKDFRDFILEQLRNLDNIDYKPMMGEYLLYFNHILFGGIYDNRLLIKITNSNKKYNLLKEIPYKTAKPMYLIENLDNIEYLCNLIKDTCNDLKK